MTLLFSNYIDKGQGQTAVFEKLFEKLFFPISRNPFAGKLLNLVK